MNSAHKNIFQTSDFFVFVGLVVGLIFEYFAPSSFYINQFFRLSLSLGLFLLASFFIVRAKTEFRKFSQRSEPNKETTKLVTTGIFQFSRNPMYIGIALIVLAIPLFIDSLWLFGVGILVIFATQYLLILPEERYLLNKFGGEYLVYFKKVRRWF